MSSGKPSGTARDHAPGAVIGGGTLPMVTPQGDRGEAPAGVRLLGVLGRGAMGEVHRGEQTRLARTVAVKKLLDGSSARQRGRFEREAQLTAQLDHPHIVPIYTLEIGSDGAAVGYVMKLVEGKTLQSLLGEAAELHRSGARVDAEHALPALLEHFLKICDALAFAHDRGVIHRDLKPANIMIGRFGEVYVMDWGVARRIGAPEAEGEDIGSFVEAPVDPPTLPDGSIQTDAALTRSGELVGTLAYMAPEQAHGRNSALDARADQYALGLMLFEIVTLQRAIASASQDEMILAAAFGHKRAFEHVGRGVRVPPELRAIVDKATALDPKDRYATTVALADDVRRYLRSDAVLARPDSAVQKVLRWIGRHRRATLLALVAAVMVAGMVVVLALYREAAHEISARERERRISALVFETSAQAHRIDQRFRTMEAALEGLRVAAEWALDGPEPSRARAPIYASEDFRDPEKQPKDLAPESKYRWPVSFDQPVTGFAPGTRTEALEARVRRVTALRGHMRRMFLDAMAPSGGRDSPEAERAALLGREGVFDYAHVSLKEGVIVLYPGMSALRPDYDVRGASFYENSKERRGKHWGNPYVDSTTDERGDDLVLPVTEALWSARGEFLGVAGVEMTVTKLVDTNLALSGRDALRTSLVDAAGRKIVDSIDARERFHTNGKDESIQLVDFEIPEVVRAIREGATEGVREIVHQGRRELVAFTRLSVLGWFYVAEVDANSVLGAR